WLIGTEASWRMKHTWRNIPACTWNQRECLRIHGDFVVPFGEVLQAFFDLLFGGTRSDAEESIGEISAVIVQLWGVVVSLWFSFLPYFGRLLIIVVDVMWQWSHIVKKLGIHRPTFVFVPDPDRKSTRLNSSHVKISY